MHEIHFSVLFGPEDPPKKITARICLAVEIFRRSFACFAPLPRRGGGERRKEEKEKRKKKKKKWRKEKEKERGIIPLRRKRDTPNVTLIRPARQHVHARTHARTRMIHEDTQTYLNHAFTRAFHSAHLQPSRYPRSRGATREIQAS